MDVSRFGFIKMINVATLWGRGLTETSETLREAEQVLQSRGVGVVTPGPERIEAKVQLETVLC